MQTFKKLGLTMKRDGLLSGAWRIRDEKDGRLSYVGNGNKGQVMADALAHWQDNGFVIFDRFGWERTDAGAR
jgi:hypothetical protein